MMYGRTIGMTRMDVIERVMKELDRKGIQYIHLTRDKREPRKMKVPDMLVHVGGNGWVGLEFPYGGKKSRDQETLIASGRVKVCVTHDDALRFVEERMGNEKIK